MKIKVLLINESGANFIDIENDYKEINRALNWEDAWNTPTIQVRGNKYICICSDTGKLRHERVACLSYDNISAPKSTLREPFIVGSVIITKFDGIEDYEALNEQDMALLKSRFLYNNNSLLLHQYFPTLLILDGTGATD